MTPKNTDKQESSLRLDAASCSLLFILLRFVAVFLPIGLAFGVLFAWLKVPQHIIPQLGMPIGSVMMLVFFDFIIDGKLRRRAGGDDRMGRKSMNHPDNLAGRITVEFDHPGVLHRLKRYAMKVPEFLRLRFHLSRRPNVIAVNSKPCNESANQNGNDSVRLYAHNDSEDSSTNV